MGADGLQKYKWNAYDYEEVQSSGELSLQNEKANMHVGNSIVEKSICQRCYEPYKCPMDMRIWEMTAKSWSKL